MRLLKLVPDNTNIPFLKWRVPFFVLSMLLIIGSWGLVLTKGLNFGVDFAGGLEVRAPYPQGTEAPVVEIRQQLEQLGYTSPTVQKFGDDNQVSIRVSLPEDQSADKEAAQAAANEIVSELRGAHPDFRLDGNDNVSGKVSGEFRQDAVLALVLAMIAVAIYIWVRFEWQFGVGALFALFHDVTLALGFFSLLGLEFSLQSVAALLAIIGYSLNDTIVVYDRIRENTNDRRPEFQQMIEAGTAKPAPFEVVVVHSFSRFFRDHFELEFYVRKLAKNGIRLVSITQEMGDDPMHVMMRQIMALFDEYQSKENAKHVLRALKENARQGFWNGSLPPIGYRVVAAEQRGAKIKKKLEIDPIHAETVRLAFRLALEGDGRSGPMGVKAITKHLNEHRIFTRDGGRWGIGTVHRMLTRQTYIGRHEFNRRTKNGDNKPDEEVIPVAVPPIIDQAVFDAVQARMKARNPKVAPPQVVGGPTLLTGLIHCAKCGGAMTIRTGKGGRYRYYTCSTKARQGPTACSGMTVPMAKLDDLVAKHLEDRLLDPARLKEVLATVLDRRQERTERRHAHIAELNKRATETDLRLKRLYDAIESGVADLDDPDLKDRIASLKAIRDQSRIDAERASAMLESAGQKAISAPMLAKFAQTARQRMRLPGGGYRRDHLRALAQRVEVSDGEVRIMGSKSDLLRTLAAARGNGTLPGGVPSFVPKWRRKRLAANRSPHGNPCSAGTYREKMRLAPILLRSRDPKTARFRGSDFEIP
ncbi:protein translocase subunit SecF [Leptolyngbya sp. 15MV]|nr:protein translocase subunit SecF [Leptolyngbya sp. 15MV]